MKSVQLRLKILVLQIAPNKKLLGVKFYSNLSFENHVTSLCKKTSQGIHPLTRISHYMDLNKRRNVMKAFRLAITVEYGCFTVVT